MAATSAKQQYATKGFKNKHHNRRFFCLPSWFGCFGGSSRISADRPGDRKLSKYGTRDASLRGKKSKAAINPSSSPDKIVSTSREIHVIEEGKDDQGTSQILAQPQVSKGKISDKDSQETYRADSLSNSTMQKMDSQNRLVQQGRSSPKTLWTTKKKKMNPHSISMPLLPLPPQPLSSPQKYDKKPKKAKQTMGYGSELNSSVGAVIVTVTLLVMLICGKACAILCAAAWLYFIPRLRSTIDDARAKDNEVGFDSWEYKKRVVLQGLLQRN